MIKLPPVAPRLVRPLRLVGLSLTDALARLTEWIANVQSLLSGEVMLGTHCAAQVLSGTVFTTAGAGTAAIETRFTQRPLAVWLVDCADSSGQPLEVPAYSWTWTAPRVSVTVRQNVATSPVTLTLVVLLG